MKKVLLLFSCVFFLNCNNNSGIKNFLPKSTGGIREMLVVYDTIYNNSKTLKLVDKILQKEVEYILQDEPIFSVIYIPKESFTSNKLIKYFRNILYLNKSQKDTIFKRKDIFSTPQSAIFINAVNENNARKIFIKNNEEILNYFIKNDDDYIQSIHRKNKWKNPDFLKPFNIDLDIPLDYSVSLQKNDFVWLIKDIKGGYYNIMIYKGIYEKIEDYSFIKKEIAKRRNFWTHKYIHGSLDSTYVKIEEKIDLSHEYTKLDGKFAIKTNGMWKMENDFMGGYFINYAIFDEISNTIYFIDGFIYLPNKKKNTGLVEIDNILRSFKKI